MAQINYSRRLFQMCIVEPLFFRFKIVLIPFQDLLIPFFTVSDLTNSVFYRFTNLKFCFIFFQAVFLVSMIFIKFIWGHSSVT